jgi:hypothetical protein
MCPSWRPVEHFSDMSITFNSFQIIFCYCPGSQLKHKFAALVHSITGSDRLWQPALLLMLTNTLKPRVCSISSISAISFQSWFHAIHRGAKIVDTIFLVFTLVATLMLHYSEILEVRNEVHILLESSIWLVHPRPAKNVRLLALL